MLEVGTQTVFFTFGFDIQTILLTEVSRDTENSGFATARQSDVMVMAEIVVVNQLVIPIGTVTMVYGTRYMFQIRFRVQNIWLACHKIMFYIPVIRNCCFTRMSLLGRYQDDTIRTTRTIDSRCRTVFQYGNRFDILLSDVA